MKFQRLVVLTSTLLVLFLCFALTRTSSAAPYTVAANNFTMPSSGNGSTAVTVVNIPLTGMLTITCNYTGPTTTAHIPVCGHVINDVNIVTAGETFNGSCTFYPYGTIVPLDKKSEGSANLPRYGAALGGVILLGFGLRRSNRHWFTLCLIALGSLTAIASLSACAGGNGMTPGSYQYTISAINSGTVTPLGVYASTTVIVTVQ